MSELESEAMEAEFGTVAGWTEEAVRALGAEHAVPAGCRGTGSEAALRWLADRLALTPGSRVLDDGAGVGGPAGWLAADRGVRPVCAEPMHAAAGAAHRLFGLPSVTALAQRLPFADAAFDAAWCLGVLCTTSDKAGALAELRRVLTDGGRLGLLVFVADRPLPPPLPEGNDFPAEAELRQLLDAAGLRLDETATADLHDSPPEWAARADAVDAEVARRHGGDRRWREAQEQAGRVGRLLSGGALRPWLGVARVG
ncbi:Methyltransferase domain-containing protein [Geodermatophilus telluris]|uniref:Methyltransferase domain-containing protein n=1 Tax=Geodermatophilus telluris TaxID=1190417 RepID=A0A1G6LCI9_9ACTN|nr:methyltransferase domain-containing protein [Geodermatophilus telluris]SDC40921.1 Methyltransferase domain-containing protein [Geodermatophilus telluris]